MVEYNFLFFIKKKTKVTDVLRKPSKLNGCELTKILVWFGGFGLDFWYGLGIFFFFLKKKTEVTDNRFFLENLPNQMKTN